MLEYSQVITEPMPRNLAAFGSMFSATAEETRELEDNIRRYYGLTFEEFIDARNALLEAHDGTLQQLDLHHSLVNRIIIDLVGRGYLRLKNQAACEGMNYIMTDKGIKALLSTQENLPEEPYAALIVLRNLGGLKE